MNFAEVGNFDWTLLQVWRVFYQDKILWGEKMKNYRVNGGE